MKMMGLLKTVGAGAIVGCVAGVVGASYVHSHRDRLHRQVNRAMCGAENAVGRAINGAENAVDRAIDSV